jgi:hypothetical protein
MTKLQKIKLYVFVAMFLIPEVVFAFVVSFFGLLLKFNTPFWLGGFADTQFFAYHRLYVFGALFVEILGILGLFIYNLRFNRNWSRWVLSFLLLILLVAAMLVFYIGYSMRHGFGF